MPVEPMTLLLRPRNFFTNNPVMDVPPSYATTPSQLANNAPAVVDETDAQSKAAFTEDGSTCCIRTSEASRPHLQIDLAPQVDKMLL